MASKNTRFSFIIVSSQLAYKKIVTYLIMKKQLC